MYGLKDENKNNRFIFDLEKKIKADPEQLKLILEKTEKKIGMIKKHLREGANEKDFDQLGVLLHAYAALQKVLKKTK